MVLFVIIDFLLILIPFAFLELRPEAARALLKHAQDWLLSHALQLMAAIALLLSAFLSHHRPDPSQADQPTAPATPRPLTRMGGCGPPHAARRSPRPAGSSASSGSERTRPFLYALYVEDPSPGRAR